jgi:TP901 family phage tail tape measure protein
MAKAASAALLGIGFKTVISEMASFETQMIKLKSLTDATTQQMKAMEKQARELGATTAFSAQQAAEAQGVLASAGLKTNDSQPAF